MDIPVNFAIILSWNKTLHPLSLNFTESLWQVTLVLISLSLSIVRRSEKS